MICSLFFASWMCFTAATPIVPTPEYHTECARVTCYGPTGYNMANTKKPEHGWVAVSDRTIPFNTVIEIDGVDYKVGDRTAKWVHTKFKYKTIDIFMQTGCDMHYGSSVKLVKIYDK